MRHAGDHSACAGARNMTYKLKFIDDLDRAFVACQIEATDDEAAVELGRAHCVCADMTVDVWEANRLITRLTPVTARLYFSDQKPIGDSDSGPGGHVTVRPRQAY